MDRRSFLAALSASGAALAAGGLAGCAPPTGWGTAPDDRARALLLPASKRPRRVLELFLWGGLSPWDTFGCVPNYGDPNGGGPRAGQPWMWWTFSGATAQYMDTCGVSLPEVLQPFGDDALGRLVHLGPLLAPLRERADIVERLRILTMSHGQFPHQTAVPLALTGSNLGSPRMAGTAAHIERWTRGQNPARSLPAAWVIQPPNPAYRTDNTTAASAVGRHPGLARPGVLRVAAGAERQARRFAREHLDGRAAQFDASTTAYTDALQRSLTQPGSDAPLRSAALDDWIAALDAMRGAPELVGPLGDGVLAAASGESCGESGELDGTRGGLRAGVRLLTDPRSDAVWSTVIDGGLIPASHMTGYDTHVDHVRVGSRNTLHALRTLVGLINAPGESDPDKLDLATDTVLLTTEFGRSPYPEDGTGLDHWSAGYTVAAFGGWADTARSGVVGAIDVEGQAVDGISPAELRAALLLAQGIWPFESEAFAVADVRGAEDRVAAATHLREHVLGYSG